MGRIYPATGGSLSKVRPAGGVIGAWPAVDEMKKNGKNQNVKCKGVGIAG